MQRMKQETTYSLRLSKVVKEAVQRKAADERRSLNRQIEMALVEDLVWSGYLLPPRVPATNLQK
jgi:hypothetical protein